MLWNQENFPQSFNYLSDTTCQKAIDVASELLRQSMDEHCAIRTALEHALIWARSARESRTAALCFSYM
jgi:uncharacterized protein YdaT